MITNLMCSEMGSMRAVALDIDPKPRPDFLPDQELIDSN